ncbi:hypothetical protein IWW48_006293, partial [Coemansia sp. RSA 1200]
TALALTRCLPSRLLFRMSLIKPITIRLKPNLSGWSRAIDHSKEMNQLKERNYKRQVAWLTNTSEELESTCDWLRSQLEDARSKNLAHIRAKAAAVTALESERADSRLRSYSMESTDAWTMTESIDDQPYQQNDLKAEDQPEISYTSNDLTAQTVSDEPKISHDQVLERSEPLRLDIIAAPLTPLPIFFRYYTGDTLVGQTAETATLEATFTKTAPATKSRAAKAAKAIRTAAAKAKAAAKAAKAAMAYICLHSYH